MVASALMATSPTSRRQYESSFLQNTLSAGADEQERQSPATFGVRFALNNSRKVAARKCRNKVRCVRMLAPDASRTNLGFILE